MSLATPAPETTATATTAPVLDVVVPVYNEENDLAPCVRKLHAHLTQRFPLVPDHHRRQRQHGRYSGDRRRTGGRAERGAGGALLYADGIHDSLYRTAGKQHAATKDAAGVTSVPTPRDRLASVAMTG